MAGLIAVLLLCCWRLVLQVLQSDETAAPAPKREIILPGG